MIPTKKTSRRGIYLLPNLLTTSGLFAAFYSIVASMKGSYDLAAIAIFIVAACLSLNLGGFHNRPSNFAVSLGVTIALIVAARLCCGIWKAEVCDPFRQ